MLYRDRLPRRRAGTGTARARHLLAALAVLIPLAVDPLVRRGTALAAAPATIERGRFVIHRYLRPVGEERYELVPEGPGLVLRSEQRLVDRGTPVVLTTELGLDAKRRPVRLVLRGQPAAYTRLDLAVTVAGARARVHEGARASELVIGRHFFPLRAWAPASLAMMLVQYAERHRVRAPFPALHGGQVTLERRDTDRLTVSGRSERLTRYHLSGVHFGGATLWVDGEDRLVAAVEPGQRETVREGYEPALAWFAERALEDSLADVADRTRDIQPLAGELRITAIRGARLIDGSGRQPVDDAVVVVEGDRIRAAGPRAQITIPRGALVIEARGLTLLPGLWDLAAHFAPPAAGPAYLAAGITTVRAVATEPAYASALRVALRERRLLGPALLLAGPLDGRSDSDSDGGRGGGDGAGKRAVASPGAGARADGLGAIEVRTAEEALAAVRRYHRLGFEQIQLQRLVPRELVAVIAEEAHRLGMSVAGEVPRTMSLLEAVQAGMDEVHHTEDLLRLMLPPALLARLQEDPRMPYDAVVVNPDGPTGQEVIAGLHGRGTVIAPTVAASELGLRAPLAGTRTLYPDFARLPHALRALHDAPDLQLERQAPDATTRMERTLEVVAALHRGGVPIVAASDADLPGLGLHRELELYVRAGLTPMAAIQAATVLAARAMKRDGELGTIEVGKRADLVLVEGDPLASIADLRRTRKVMVGGQLYACDALWRSVGFRTERGVARRTAGGTIEREVQTPR